MTNVALTIWQPWASLIILGHKPVENRTWVPPARLIGQRIFVHAGRKWDDDGALWIEDEFPELAHMLADRARIPSGALLGTVRLTGVSALPTGPWWVGPVGWELRDPIALPEPIACPGAQGLWTVPAGVVERVSMEGANAH